MTIFPNLTGDASYENARENYTARNVARELTPAEDTRSNSHLRADRTPALGVINALQDCAAELGRMPTYVEYSAWAQRVGATGPQTVRNRFGGSWMAAIEAAIADEVLAA